MLHKYKTAFNINKLLKWTFITKRKYYNKLKTCIRQKYINIYIIKKISKNYFYDYENRNNVKYMKK